MYHFFVGADQILKNQITITGSDVNHMKNVLRMKPGEEISVSCISGSPAGQTFRCRIVSLEEDRILCQQLSLEEETTELPCRVHLFQGLPKADKMEFIIQKAVELGAYEVIPVATRRCVVKLDDKKARAKTERWQAIAEAAAKQSKRGIIPKVAQVTSFGQALQKAASMEVGLIPYELAQEKQYVDMRQTRELIDSIKPGQDIAVFVGPEGGFEESEVEQAMEAGMKPILLGKRILRTETAGITVLAWLIYRLED